MEMGGGEKKSIFSTFWGGMGCGCLVLVIVGAFVLGPQLYQAAKQKREPMYLCVERMTKIGQAMSKYEKKEHALPPSLQALVPDYMPKTMLYCPLKRGSLANREYQYQVPPQDSYPLTPVIICKRHPKIVVVLRKDGNPDGWEKSKEQQ